MESSHKSHAIELEFISVAQCQISDDATESGTQLEAATSNHLHAPVTALRFDCSGTHIL